MPFGEEILAAQADVVYATNLGQFKVDQAEIEAVYARTTGAMSDEALKLSIAQERLNRAIAQQGPESLAAGRATVAYRAQLDELAASEVATAAAADKASQQRLASYAGAARSVGSTLTRYVTAPTALAAAAAVKLAFDFNGSMRLIQTQAGASAGEVNYASGAILNLVSSGNSFGQTANDMSKGLFEVESEGIRGARAMEILRVAAAGAAVGGTDLIQTANALTSAMRVYDVSAGGAAKTQATLNAIVGAGKLHLDDLVAALSTKYLPVAKQLGIPLDQAGAALTVFTRAGVPAESAATNLTTALTKILSPSKTAAASLGQLDLNSSQLANDLQNGGLTSALATLSKHYDQLVASQGKVAANQAIFGAFGGVRGGASILTLVQQYSQYVQGLDEIQRKANPGTFWSDVAVTMREPANQVHQDIAKIGADLIEVGNKLAPLVVDVVGGVAHIADAIGKLPGPAKDAAAALLGIVAIGGPLLLFVGSVIRGVEAIDRAWGKMTGSATAAVTTSDEQLAILRTNAAETATALETAGTEGGAGLAAGVGAGVTAAEADLTSLGVAEAGVAAEGGGIGLLGGGQLIQSVVPGQTGQTLGSVAEYAGLGAALGSFVGPEGTAIGAGVGAIVGGITSLIHDGPSFVQQMDAMGQSVSRFNETAAASAHAITQLHQQIANDRVGRDQAQQELIAAQAEEKATRGTNQHADAVDRLRAAQANLSAATQQVTTDTAKATQAQKTHEAAVRAASKQTALEEEALFKQVADQAQQAQHIVDVGMEGGTVYTADATTAAKRYVDQLTALANSAQSSQPKLAAVFRELAQIAANVHRIPSEKTVRIVIKEIYDAKPSKGGGILGEIAGGIESALKNVGKEAAKYAKTHHIHAPTPFTTTIPIGLQINLQRAQNANDVGAERRYLDEEKAFLQRELAKAEKAKNKQDELAALQALGAVDSQLSTLQTKSTSAGKKRKSAYLTKVQDEQNKLEINLARAQLAEKNAGLNQQALDRAYKAEKRALDAEIEFYRKESHDQDLALAERQKYAKLAIAAEAAKLKIGKESAKQLLELKKAEAQVLVDLQTILQNYAPNVFPQKPDVHVHQHFPNGPTDHHRQARNALVAVRAAFDS